MLNYLNLYNSVKELTYKTSNIKIDLNDYRTDILILVAVFAVSFALGVIHKRYRDRKKEVRDSYESEKTL